MDDDDVISLNFFDQIEAHVSHESNGYRISLARGLEAIYDDGVFYGVRDRFVPFIAIGLPSIQFYSMSGKIINSGVKAALPYEGKSGHTTSPVNAPVITDGTQISWLRTRTLGADTSLGSRPIDRYMKSGYKPDEHCYGSFIIERRRFNHDLPLSL